MNTQNETIVSGRVIDELRRAGLSEGYQPVPRQLEREAHQILNGQPIASMTKGFAGRAKKAAVRNGNRRRDDAIREARQTLAQEGLLR